MFREGAVSRSTSRITEHIVGRNGEPVHGRDPLPIASLPANRAKRLATNIRRQVPGTLRRPAGAALLPDCQACWFFPLVGSGLAAGQQPAAPTQPGPPPFLPLAVAFTRSPLRVAKPKGG